MGLPETVLAKPASQSKSETRQSLSWWRLGVVSLSAFLVGFAFLAATDSAALAQKGKVPVPRASPVNDARGDAPAEGAVPAGADDAALFEGEDGEFLPADEMPLDATDADGLASDTAGGADPATAPIDFNAGLRLDPSDQPIDLGNASTAPIELAPNAATEAAPADPAVLGSLSLDARLTTDGPPLAAGMSWRVFADEIGPDGKMRLVGEASGGPVTLKLRPGNYFVHASYGRAGVTKKVTVAAAPGSDTIILNAGGLRLAALVGKDQRLADADVVFDIYAPDEGGSDERVLLVADAPPTRVIGLAAGTYQVVCRYGDANAVVRADIRVEAGKLTDATVYQKAARLTLKLVEEKGGEALANTSWSVVTPSGERVSDSVGAFPSVVLAAGDYTAIAKHENKIYERNFTVEAGLNRDVEVLRAE